MSTLSNTGDPYIVVLDGTADVIRALLFDREATRVEGYSAQLPRRTVGADLDCLDEMHRLVSAAGFQVGAVVGRGEKEVTAEDRSFWPAFRDGKWFPALPDGASAILGSGCVDRERFGLLIGDDSMLGTVVENLPRQLPLGLVFAPIDEKRWFLAGAVPEAGSVYASLKHELKVKGSMERYLETAPVDDPHLAPLESILRQFREVYELLSSVVGTPAEVLACGTTLLKSPSMSQRIANSIAVSLTVCSEPEPAGRGSALWALEQIGAIGRLAALPASTAAVFHPVRRE